MARNAGRPSGSRKYGSDAFSELYTSLELRGFEPRELLAALDHDFPELVQQMSEPLRTIQRWVREDRSHDTSGPWRVWDSEPEDVPAMFETIGALMQRTGGEVRWLTAAEAKWITRIQRMGITFRIGNADEPLDPLETLVHARRMVRSQIRKDGNVADDLLFGMETELLALDTQLMLAGMTLGEWLGEWIGSSRGTHTSTHNGVGTGGIRGTPADSD